MKLNNKWSQGQLYAFSGLDGECSYRNGLVGYTLGDKIGIRFKLPVECDLYFSECRFKSLNYSMVTGGCIVAEADGEELSLILLDQHTVVGTFTSKCKPKFVEETLNGYSADISIKDNKFAFAIAENATELEVKLSEGLETDIEALIKQRIAFFEKFEPNKEHESLYYKCLSVMKTQIYTPEGPMKLRWSTPDRYPHRSMWIWDSVFHAMGFRHFDTTLSEELILSIFTYQEENGFIPHFSNSDCCSKISQPPVIAYGALKVYEKSNNKAFLEEIYNKNKIFLDWCKKYRIKGSKNLYTWLTEPDLKCRCGESGMDNSTRFDIQDELYAIDFCCFVANEYRCMSKIATILEKTDDAAEYDKMFAELRNDINDNLWDENQGFYFDKAIISEEFHDVSSVSSFLPLFAGICDKEKAEKLVETFYREYNTPVPLPSISKNSKYYGDDMWRGPVWINYSVMIAEGFAEFGYTDIADDIKERTIAVIEKYYNQSGCTFEFYDSEDITHPSALNRKGSPVEPYNPSIRYQTIRDYGWTTTLAFDWLNC